MYYLSLLRPHGLQQAKRAFLRHNMPITELQTWMCQNTEKYIVSAIPRAGVSVDRREWNEVLIIHNPRHYKCSFRMSASDCRHFYRCTLINVSDCSRAAPLALLSVRRASQPIAHCALNQCELAGAQGQDRRECTRGASPKRHRARRPAAHGR